MESLIDSLPHAGSPIVCAFCGRTTGKAEKEFKMLCGKDNNAQWVLSVFEECDDHDEPNGRFLVLCAPGNHRGGCSEGPTIEDHPRLYVQRYYGSGDVCPGAMPQCNSCQFRKGPECQHPSRWSAGLAFSRPITSRDKGMDWTSNPRVLDLGAPTDWPMCQSRLGVVEVREANP
jgi:hypothetical protein